MKLGLGIGALLLATGSLVDMVSGEDIYMCANNKCTGKCYPTDGGRDGTVPEEKYHPGDAWCYLKKTGSQNPAVGTQPITCLDGIGCSEPASGAVCLTKDWDEKMGGCAATE